ncbi:uncharacterized protein FOMMEDRAFT_58472, partial [Fomitiporia mediterranea MF3/22]|uniref:uncharacterized protein n=1 Tax=Fomitiporia mediterranea (strain MF3/22) TaxID=694068 RepID=UPI0004408524
QEKIAGVVLWLKPGQTLDIGLCTLLRSGFHKVLLGWGIEGMKRLTVEFSPAVEHALEKTFKARQLDRLDSWHLLTIVVDPEHEGNGLCSLMMKDGFARTAPKPVHLEATTSKSRDIYARYGFEVNEEHRYGKGKVDSNGLKARGDAATGYPEWIMTKAST